MVVNFILYLNPFEVNRKTREKKIQSFVVLFSPEESIFLILFCKL